MQVWDALSTTNGCTSSRKITWFALLSCFSFSDVEIMWFQQCTVYIFTMPQEKEKIWILNIPCLHSNYVINKGDQHSEGHLITITHRCFIIAFILMMNMGELQLISLYFPKLLTVCLIRHNSLLWPTFQGQSNQRPLDLIHCSFHQTIQFWVYNSLILSSHQYQPPL